MSALIREFGQDFAKLVKKYEQNPAIIVNSELNPRILTYQDLDNLINRCLLLFKKKGLGHGNTIFSLLPNAVETLVIFLATIKGGYGFAPLPCTASKREIGQWLDLVNPKLCITTNLASEDAQTVIAKKGVDSLNITTDTRFDWLPVEQRQLRLGCHPRMYLATSGTTGDPKALLLDSLRLWSSGYAFMKFHNLHGSSLRFWNYLPMSYLGGLFNLGTIPLCIGGSIVLDEPFSGKTFLQFWQTVDRYDITALWFVPSIVRGLLKMAELTHRQDMKKWGRKIKKAFLGTAPIDLVTKQKFEDLFGIQLLENFALSETTFFTTETNLNVASRVKNSVGEILPYVDVKFVPLAKNRAFKEIYVKSPFLFLGYLEKDGSLTEPFDNEGFLGTEDLGHLNKDRIFIIDGRRKDIIKKGGYFISLKEIEALAKEHGAVLEAAAVPIQHEFYGESFLLFLILKEGFSKDTEEDISQFIHRNLVQYKWPEKIVPRKEFPRTSSGKIKKHLLLQEKNA